MTLNTSSEGGALQVRASKSNIPEPCSSSEIKMLSPFQTIKDEHGWGESLKKSASKCNIDYLFSSLVVNHWDG